MTKHHPQPQNTRPSIPNETLPSTSGRMTTAVRKASTPTYESTSDSGKTNNDRRGSEQPLSPSYTMGGTETPMVTSPDASVVAIHGSVMTNFPMPRGGKHEGKMSIDDWARIASNIPRTGKGSVSAQGQGQGVIPETPIEEGSEVSREECKNEGQEDVSNRPDDAKPGLKNNRIIAIDFDDVCSENMATIVKQHNLKYGTDLTLDDLQTYVFWQNRGFGTPAEVARKVQTLNNLLPLTTPIPGFAEGLTTLHNLGHPIHIVTSRPESDKQSLVDWLSAQGITIGPAPGDVIAEAHFTGSYGDVNKSIEPRGTDDESESELNERLKELWKDGVGKGKGGLAKLKILRTINASLFIDDHHGNLEPIVSASPPIPCLLFGEYGWNRSRSGVTSPVEMMDYNERMSSGLPLPFQEIRFGKEENMYRVRDWEELVEWVKKWDGEGVEV
ncbi:hypothetical protein I302_105893 [Kwoniella bestiolae CBS 10118]|uniref:Uncharacterized protein n=1 Tax=Kwoniella bestiolae CBS 10118 TaxID=1296100 RepID=A0A1B9G2G8_9TREE|nr:hypothetical protein I302_05018 [Kwoniella bestiolae CBS 10118]OCF25205.1 hypothetical protein I302_05018 [Kwoniella bestiolae CBS 10118]